MIGWSVLHFCVASLLFSFWPSNCAYGNVVAVTSGAMEPIKWPTKAVAVPALITKPGSLFGLYQPKWAARHQVSIFNYQTHDPSQPLYNPNSKYGLENVAYFRFLADHYHNLPEITVLIHPDASCHNRYWLEWLQCLRPNVGFTSLSTVFVQDRVTIAAADEEVDLLVDTFNLSSGYKQRLRRGQPRNFYCCEQWILRKEAILRYPHAAYQAMYDLVASHQMSAFLFEYNLHVLFGEDVAGPLKPPCEHFDCEREFCKRVGAGVRTIHYDKSKSEPLILVNETTGAKSFGPIQNKPRWWRYKRTGKKHGNAPVPHFCWCVKRRTLDGSVLYYHPVTPDLQSPICLHYRAFNDPRCDLPAALPENYVVDLGGCHNQSMEFECHLGCGEGAEGVAVVSCPVNGQLFNISGCLGKESVLLVTLAEPLVKPGSNLALPGSWVISSLDRWGNVLRRAVGAYLVLCSIVVTYVCFVKTARFISDYGIARRCGHT